jgi:hypothetical protein
MKAYVGQVGHDGLRRFVAEDILPADVLQELIRGWTSTTATVVQAVVDQDAIEEIWRELMSSRPDAACGVLLNRAIELVPLRPAALDLSRR